MTDWVDEHPGGPQALFTHMGKDASEEFAMLHDVSLIDYTLNVRLLT